MSLDIAVTKSPFRKPTDNENFDIGRCLEIDEWQQLFENVLQAPVEIERFENEDPSNLLIRKERLFQEDLTNKGYEMLGRIWYYFRDVFYTPSEVTELLAECLKIQQRTQNKFALSALESLIFACNEAIKVNSGIWLISD
jgi:hypothetical protein